MLEEEEEEERNLIKDGLCRRNQKRAGRYTFLQHLFLSAQDACCPWSIAQAAQRIFQIAYTKTTKIYNAIPNPPLHHIHYTPTPSRHAEIRSLPPRSHPEPSRSASSCRAKTHLGSGQGGTQSGKVIFAAPLPPISSTATRHSPETASRRTTIEIAPRASSKGTKAPALTSRFPTTSPSLCPAAAPREACAHSRVSRARDHKPSHAAVECVTKSNSRLRLASSPCLLPAVGRR
jgi:hypothetical protein